MDCTQKQSSNNKGDSESNIYITSRPTITMTDPYGEFEESDDMEENDDDDDDDIGALGSILSWDEQDEAVGTSATALDDSNHLSSQPAQRSSFASYPQQISIVAMQANNQAIQAQISQQPYQLMMQSPQGYQMQQHTYSQQNAQNQQQQIQLTMQAQNQQQTAQQPQQIHTYAVPTTTQQQQMMQLQQAANSAVSQNQVQQSQQQQIQAQLNQQQQQAQVQLSAMSQQAMSSARPMLATASQSGQYTAIFQPQLYANATPDQISMQSMSMVHGQTQQAQDPNSFLRQMQIQYQQVPGSVSRTLPQAPIMMQQQQSQMMAPSTSAAALSQSSKRLPLKRKGMDVKPPAAPKSNVVSCSDTDGETKTSCESSKKAKKTGSESTEDEDAMANMTPAEKAKANRDRNREHARNTRLRKKAYLEQLKMTVDELCLERDTLVSERAGASTILVEMHNTRTEVLMSLFALRSVYERQRELWASILDESCFACVMPVTPYRSFPASEVQVSKCQRTVLGIDGIIADTASLHVLLNNLVDRSRFPTAQLQFRYTLVTEDAVVAGNQMMARWVMSTTNATQLGARMEVAKQGMLCCKFNSAHKIIGLELMFDVMAFMLQLKQATGSHEFAVVPNTVQTCQRAFKQPMVMTLAEPPYTIVQVNKLWEEMTGFKAENVVGKASCRILQGQETNRKSVDDLMSEVRYKRPASAVLVNYTNQGKMFRNFMNAYPLSTDSKITHFVALTVHAEPINPVDPVTSISADKMAPSPAPISVHNVQSASVLNPSAQLTHIQPAQNMHASNQLMMQSQPAHTGAGMPMPLPRGTHVMFYQAQPGILPKPSSATSGLQAAPVITPKSTKTNEIASQTHKM